jgi:hypothetical protein
LSSFQTPLFPAHITAKAIEALNAFIMVHGHDDAQIVEAHIAPVRLRMTHVVDCLFPENGDQEEFAGTDTLDGNDYVHPIKVAELAVCMGRNDGMARSKLISLALGAALMNVGYFTVRRSVMDEPRQLVNGEWEEHIKTHAAQSITLLADCGLSSDTLTAIAEHHEHVDGSGYPAGLRGDAISDLAQLIAVADAYITSRSYRPQRPRLDVREALDEMRAEAGAEFDPRWVDLLCATVARYGGEPASGPRVEAPDVASAGAPEDHASAQAAAAQRDREERAARDRERLAAEEEERHQRRNIAAAAVLSAQAGADPEPLRSIAGAAQDAGVSTARRSARRGSSGRRMARRAVGRRGSLFATPLYVDAAVSGEWRP